MPKQTKILSDIPSLYKNNALNLSAFAFIRGVRAALHTVSVSKAIDLFMEEYGLTDEDINRDSLAVTYNRLQKQLIDLKKTENGR